MVQIQDILPQVIEIARQAGQRIMTYYLSDNTVFKKSDNSPVTIADHEANAIIVEGLSALTPKIPIVSEEGEQPDVSGSSHFWLVDPLDGTKSFIRKSGYFTVNIALIENRLNPLAGVIYDPVSGIMYYGSSAGAFREHKGRITRINVAKNVPPQTALISHSHLDKATEEYLSHHAISTRIPCASSIKFCFLAEGKADVYPRFGPTMEWDVGAGHAILKAAGGNVTMPDGSPFQYGKADFLNGNFIAFS